jgi:hypothetical protein
MLRIIRRRYEEQPRQLVSNNMNLSEVVGNELLNGSLDKVVSSISVRLRRPTSHCSALVNKTTQRHCISAVAVIPWVLVLEKSGCNAA